MECLSLSGERNGGGRPRGNGHPDRFAALADPTRRHLLLALASNECTVSELASGLGISQPAVSQHLRMLRETGLVEYCCTGRSHRYRLCTRSLREMCDWIIALDRAGLDRTAATEQSGSEHGHGGGHGESASTDY